MNQESRLYRIAGHLLRVRLESPWTFKELTARQTELVARLASGEDVGVESVPADRQEQLSVNEALNILENSLLKKERNYTDFMAFEKALEELLDDLKIVMQNIAEEQANAAVIIKHIDPEATKKLMTAIEELKPAVESCSSTLCKRILDSLEEIMFTQEQEKILQKLHNQVEDYDFTEAAASLKRLEETLEV